MCGRERVCVEERVFVGESMCERERECVCGRESVCVAERESVCGRER